MAAAEDEVSEFLSQNRETAAWAESLRGEYESDKLWRHRREFILRNMSDFCVSGEPPESNHKGLDRLIAYSMVWCNHVFTGCRYPHPVMEKVLKMAETIKVTDAPVHTTRDELVSKVKKRGISSSNEGVEEEPLKKQKTADSTYTQQVAGQPSDEWSSSQAPCNEAQRTDTGTYQPASQQRSNNHECHAQTVKVQLQSSVNTVKAPRKLTSEDIKERQSFFNRLYKTVAWKLVSAGGFGPSLNHSELLCNSIESLKSTLDIDFVPLKELADLPQSKTSQESIVCELRCQAVYLGMGCGKTKENAKAVASREAIKLFLKKKVVVRICKRKYCGREVEDLVLLNEDSRCPNLPPALKNPLDLI